MPETDANTRNPDDAHSTTADNNSGNIHEECKSLKIADKNAEDEDPNKHLAKITIQREVKNRVKLYVLCDQRVWDDKGTGHVACVPSPEHQGATFIVVRLEHSEKNILESRILMDTIYQKQQETLIVWSESDTCDLALSFQDKTGCEDIWEKICQVQGRDPEQHPDFTGNYEDLDDSEGLDSVGQGYSGQRSAAGATITLPPCELNSLADIEVMISNSFGSAALREKLAIAIENQGYVAKLCDLFHMCEDLEHIDALHTLHQIARSLFMLNRNTLLEILLSEKYFKDIVGMLEYDPAEPKPRKHREFLFQKARFREVLPIHNDELRQKIHQTYRVQYVQDICLPAPSLFEENLLSVLNSYLFFNRVDIVSLLQDDKQLLKDLFDQLKNPATTTERRKDLTMFLKEFCSFSTSLQPNGPQGRENFYKTLMQNDVLAAIEPCITSKDVQTRATTVEMFVMIVEFNPQTARDYLLQQGRGFGEAKNNQLLLNKLIDHMLTDRDPELTSAYTMVKVMQSLLDPDNMITAPNMKSERHEFLTFFYRRSMETLCRPLYANTENDTLKRDNYHCANQQAMIIDILCFCFEHHAVHMRNYCISNKLLNRVLVLLKSKHHFLALSALRLFRRVVQLKDEFYYRYTVRDDVMQPIVECFRKNGHRYNLLNSAIIELFEFIRMEDIKPLIIYVVENFGKDFEDVIYVTTFKSLRLKYEQMRDREGRKMEDSSPSDSLISVETNLPAQWKMERQADADEQWFNDDDSENASPTGDWDPNKQGKEPGTTLVSHSALLDVSPSSSAASVAKEDESLEKSITTRKMGIEPLLPNLLKRKVEDESDAVFQTQINVPLKTHIAPRIIIKVNTDKQNPSLSLPAQPTCNSPPGDPVVSSTETGNSPSSSTSSRVASSASVVTVLAKKPLVEYDESDSDEEDETTDSGSTGDSLPSSSSSIGRPSSNLSSQSSSDDQDDVSSTSGDHEPSPVSIDDIKKDEDQKDQSISRKRSSESTLTGETIREQLVKKGDISGDDLATKRLRLHDGNFETEAVRPNEQSALK
ncbi:CBR-SMK-1 protein [Loa loa]|nr:CBR-SMK-1 protein [Loa loa]EJD76774.1 CBR-SMK-1 protein [Loa loa]